MASAKPIQSIPVSLLVVALSIHLPSGVSGEAATGWYGEVLPAGLERGNDRGEYVWVRDGSVMVYIPAGPFTMGSDDGDPDERPAHEVWLDAFYIDKHEVSWRRYERSGAVIYDSPTARRPGARAPDWGIRDDHPVLNVTWQDARDYAAWAGKRLPTEAEWEKAARGTDGRTFPWGDEPPTFEHAVWKDHPIAATSTAPVTCCAAGASPFGALNMAGNVYEWVLDTYESRFYARSSLRNPVNRADGDFRVLRGGAFLLPTSDLRAALRYRLLARDRTPYIGFRTALSAAPADPEE